MSHWITDTAPPDLHHLTRDDFLFLSPDGSLLASGRYAEVTRPLADAADLDSLIQRDIRRLFRQAEADGISRPILVGAIPFDQRQPAALFIPERSRWFDRRLLPPAAAACACGVRSMSQRPDRDCFCSMVSSAVEAARSRRLDKVVLSRLLEIETDAPLDSIEILRQLNQQNPGCYNFHVPLDEGALVGASPELLVRKQGRAIRSLPLAGSARRSEDSDRDCQLCRALVSSAKDNHEHRLVIAAMRRALDRRCCMLQVPETPSAIATPVLWHLATEIQGTVRDMRENALSVACLLYPTPALCGVPFLEAKNLIAGLEPFDRRLFGGIVGWCDARGDGEWVVTIRCGEIADTRVRLFAGAGIVADSQSDAEWRETGTKFTTMLRAFGLQPEGGVHDS